MFEVNIKHGVPDNSIKSPLRSEMFLWVIVFHSTACCSVYMCVLLIGGNWTVCDLNASSFLLTFYLDWSEPNRVIE